MKYFIWLTLFLSACVQPPEGGSNPNLYFSEYSVINGINTVCLNCLIMERQQISVRFSFGNNPDESCSDAGTAFYSNSNNETLAFPSPTTPSVTWDLVTTANNYPSCFPSNMSVVVDYLDTNRVQLTFNGSSYSMKQSN